MALSHIWLRWIYGKLSIRLSIKSARLLVVVTTRLTITQNAIRRNFHEAMCRQYSLNTKYCRCCLFHLQKSCENDLVHHDYVWAYPPNANDIKHRRVHLCDFQTVPQFERELTPSRRASPEITWLKIAKSPNPWLTNPILKREKSKWQHIEYHKILLTTFWFRVHRCRYWPVNDLYRSLYSHCLKPWNMCCDWLAQDLGKNVGRDRGGGRAAISVRAKELQKRCPWWRKLQGDRNHARHSSPVQRCEVDRASDPILSTETEKLTSFENFSEINWHKLCDRIQNLFLEISIACKLSADCDVVDLRKFWDAAFRV